MAHDEIPDWMKGWNEYRRTLDEDAEERAYEAGFRRGRASALERHFEPAPGTIQWAITQVLAGRTGKRRGSAETIIAPFPSSNDRDMYGLALTFADILATDWELVETPDSPCDSP